MVIMKWILVSVLLATHANLWAKLELSALFSDRMVLQRNMPNSIWGWDEPGTVVTVSFAGKTYEGKASPAGEWKVVMDAEPASANSRILRVSGSEVVEIFDVLVGEVWVCSGEHPMEIYLRETVDGDLARIMANSDLVRGITVPHVGSQEMERGFEGKWSILTKGGASWFSAIGFYYGTCLQRALGVPVGVIDNSWGGSTAETWMRRSLLEADERFNGHVLWSEKRDAYFQSPEAASNHLIAFEKWEREVADWERQKHQFISEGKGPPHAPIGPERWFYGRNRPGNLFGGVVHPLLGYGIQGVIWYHGKGNKSRASGYGEVFPALIEHWREEWGIGDFSFYWAQLPGYGEVSEVAQESVWAVIRDGQTAALRLPATGQAVLVDLKDAGVRPDKHAEAVATRFVRIALAKDYGFDLLYQSPQFRSLSIDAGKAELQFECFGSQGLKISEGDRIRGFAVCGEDRKWRQAEALIVAPNVIEVWHSEVAEPVAVRYAWADRPDGNVCSEEDLPLSPFDTDALASVGRAE